MTAAPNALRLNPADNVVVAMRHLAPGEAIAGESVAAVEAIPSGHKVATRPIAAGEIVRKYGQVIGAATADIAPGAHVHTQNLAMSALREDASHGAAAQRQEPPRSFQGYRRATGKAGVRNYLGVLTSVNCSATVARHIAEAAERSGMLDDYPDIDGVVPITHASGCGMAGSGEGFDMLRRTLWGTAANPNFGGVLLVGLGCEVVQIGRLKSDYGLVDDATFQSFTIQETGGTRRAIEEGLARLQAMLPLVGAARRQSTPASELSARPAVRRLGRLVGRHLQPGAGRRVGSAGGPRRHGDPLRDAGDLRRRAPADRARHLDRRRRQAARAPRLVGGLHRAATARRWTTTPPPATRPAA